MDRVNGASGDHERNNDSIFAELSRGGKFGLEEVDDGASITGMLVAPLTLIDRDSFESNMTQYPVMTHYLKIRFSPLSPL